jgi:hypothetical protein
MLVSRRNTRFSALIGPAFVGIALITGFTLISLKAVQAADRTEDIASRASSCPALPDVVWWKTSHVKIVKYVDRKYRGNWTPYIVRWENYRSKMQDILERNGTALVKSRDIRLRGRQLAEHIVQIEQRLTVTRCLKRKFSGQLAQNNNASGDSGNDRINPNIRLASLEKRSAARSPTSSQDRVSSINDAKLDIEVTARCDGDTVTFQVTNLADVWPRLAAISIHRTKNNALVSKRRMRLKNSQQATFKVRKRGKALKGEIGLFVQPAWAKRPFRYDSKIRCR